MGSGECDSTGATSGRWQAGRQVACTNESKISAQRAIWQTLGRGEFLQRVETHHGISLKRTTARSDIGRSSLESTGLLPQTLGIPFPAECFLQSTFNLQLRSHCEGVPS